MLPLRFTPILSLFFASAGLSQTIAPQHPRHVVIEKTCARDLKRFCPDLADTGQLRNQVICLKPYRIDLTLPCHRAVNSALR